MNTEKAFKMYFGIHLHFTQLNYSVLTYGTNTKSAQSKYDSLTTSQRYRFEWMSTKFVSMQDFVYACIGCEFSEINPQFGTKDDIINSFHVLKSRRESMTYTLKNEIQKHELLDFIPVNKLIFKFLIDEISPEYIILLCHDTDKLHTLYNLPNMVWAKNKILMLIKYKDFFNVSKYLPLINNHDHLVATK